MFESMIKSTVKITTKAGGRESYGSGIVMSRHHILTALHIIPTYERDSINDNNEIIAMTHDGHVLKCKVKNQVEDSDLAVLESKQQISAPRLKPVSDIPKIGTDCVWCGYPILIGERSRRIRFGWGRISSLPYGPRKNMFEIDGNFSPAHSGSPIVNTTTGELIGLISLSAGDPRLHFKDYERYIRSLKFIVRFLDLPSRLLESYEESLRKMNISYLPPVPSDSHRLMREEIPKEILNTLKEVGVRLREMSHFNISYVFDEDRADRRPTIDTVSIVGFQSMLEGVVELILMITNSIEEAVDKTFQMGIGVASGGEPMLALVTEY